MTAVPVWVPEDFTCPECGFEFTGCPVESVPDRLAQVSDEIRHLVSDRTREQLRYRATPGTWSSIEYLCHLRDVFQATAVRVYRSRIESTPRLEPLFNDQRAAWFRYVERDVVPVLDELDAARAGCCEELARVEDWARTVMRLPGETRTAAWLARAAVHEAVHHRDDIAGLMTRA